MHIVENPQAKFSKMEDGTAAEWEIIKANAYAHVDGLPDRVLTHMNLLADDFGGFAVDRLEHSLQTATRAMEDGRDEEFVVCALLHDIGDTLGPMNHADIAAAILQPFVSVQNHWIVQHHGVFQGYYFFEYFGLDKNMREKFKGHEHYEVTEEFCRKYDQVAFDANFTSMPLEEFAPMVRRVLKEPRNSIYLE